MPTRSLPHPGDLLSCFVMLDLFHLLRHFAVPALTLLVRNLAAHQIADCETRHPALDAFLTRCAQTTEPGTSTVAWICASFGVQRQQDWPAGAILAQATGAPDDSAFWLCAQPVHLTVDRDDLVLLPSSRLHLSEDESRALFSFLETHCAASGLQMRYIDTGLWCIGSQRSQNLSTTETEFAQGRSVSGLLPSGKDAGWWQRLVLEMQMALHEHPINVAREQRGESPVNSLWLWGGGTASRVRRGFDTLCVADPLLRAVALLSGARLVETARVNDFSGSEHGLVEFVADTSVSLEASLALLESDWLSPAWEALGKGLLEELTMVLALPGRLIICRCDRTARRRFWRRRRAFQRQIVQWQLNR